MSEITIKVSTTELVIVTTKIDISTSAVIYPSGLTVKLI